MLQTVVFYFSLFTSFYLGTPTFGSKSVLREFRKKKKKMQNEQSWLPTNVNNMQIFFKKMIKLIGETAEPKNSLRKSWCELVAV